MNELGIQTELVKATIARGGYSFKMSNRFLVGVPDLFMQLEPYRTVLCEVKYVASVPRSGRVRAELTPHQARIIDKVNRSGGRAGWACFVRIDKGEYWWFASRSTEPFIGAIAMDATHIKRRGQPWPSSQLIGELNLC